MRVGFIVLETHPDHPGLMRVIKTTTAPNPPEGDDGGTIRYVVRFNDVDAAQMHIHDTLRHHCEDIDAGRYRVELVEAVAAAESVELKHERIWIDHHLNAVTMEQINDQVDKLHQRHLRVDKIARVVGAIAVALLVLRFLGVF